MLDMQAASDSSGLSVPGQRSPVGHRPWHCRESDVTERLTLCLSMLGGAGERMRTERSSCSHLCIPAAELLNFKESEKTAVSDADLI